MSEDVRDRVAQAICNNDTVDQMPWEDLSEHWQDTYLRQADAAIAAHLEALGGGGYVVVKLPVSPSEYWGAEHQPQWNHYPFTRVDGDEIEIGARCEHVFRVNALEARVFAADVLAAAEELDTETP